MILLWTMPAAIRRRRYLKASKRGQRASMQLKLKLSNLLIISIITYLILIIIWSYTINHTRQWSKRLTVYYNWINVAAVCLIDLAFSRLRWLYQR